VRKLLFILLCLLFIQAPGTTDFWISPEAESIPFDPLTSGLTSTEVGPAIREAADSVAVSASPGFTWGKSGNITNSYLLNDTVPSNLAGRIVPITAGYIAEIFVSAEVAATCTITIYKRTDPGPVFTPLDSISLIAVRTMVAASTASVARGDEIAVKVTAGSVKNPVVGLVIKGEVSGSPP